MSSVYPPGFPTVLPPGVRADLAYIQSIAFEDQRSAVDWRHMPDGSRVDLPLSVFAIFQTSAAVGNRTVVIVVYDGNFTPRLEVPGAAAQPAGQTLSYSWLYGASTLAGPVGAYEVQPLPLLPLPPGWTLQATVNGGQAGDTFQQGGIVAVRYPTGPKLPDAAPLAPTPVLL